MGVLVATGFGAGLAVVGGGFGLAVVTVACFTTAGLGFAVVGGGAIVVVVGGTVVIGNATGRSTVSARGGKTRREIHA